MTFAALSLIGVSTTQLHAQRRSLPPPVQAPQFDTPDLAKWKEAYYTAGEPVIAILCGEADLNADAAGDRTFNLVRSGFSDQFAGIIDEFLNVPAFNPEFIDTDAAQAALDDLADRLTRRGESQALALLSQELGADWIILTRFPSEQGGGLQRMRTLAFDASTGQSLFTRSFSFDRPTTPIEQRRYASVLTNRFVEDIYARFTNPPRMSVRIFGFPADLIEQNQLIEQVKLIPGLVDGHRIRPRTAVDVNPETNESQTLTSFRMKYPGASFSLAAEIARVIQSVSNGRYKVEPVSVGGSSISLWMIDMEEIKRQRAAEEAERQARIIRANEPGIGEPGGIPIASVPLSVCKEIFLDNTDGATLRAGLTEFYEQNNRPRFAVMLNRSASGAVAGAVALNSYETPETSSRRIDVFQSQSNLIENSMLQMLGAELLGFRIVDTTIVRANVRKKIDKQQDVMLEGELAQILLDENVADVVIFGSGDVFSQPGSREDAFEYTFRAVQLADAAILGAATVTEPLGSNANEEVANRVAVQALNEIACQILKAWNPPSTLTLRMNNMQTERQAQQFRNAIAAFEKAGGKLTLVDGPAISGGRGQGYFTATIDYNCSYQELFDQFDGLRYLLNFDFSIENLDRNNAVFSIEG